MTSHPCGNRGSFRQRIAAPDSRRKRLGNGWRDER